MIYVALYTSKNTHDEDIKDYAKAGKQMMRRIIAEYGDKLDQLDDAERKKIGVRAIMGAVHKVTTSHDVSAPLASYIVRNGSLFYLQLKIYIELVSYQIRIRNSYTTLIYNLYNQIEFNSYLNDYYC